MTRRIALAVAAVAAALALPTAAAAAPAAAGVRGPDIHALKLKKTILADPKVSANVKAIVRLGGFGGIERPTYADLTGDGDLDVLVPIASGGTAGTIAFYVYSYHFGKLRNVMVRNNVYKVGLKVQKGDLVVTVPIYGANDPNCCPSKLEKRTFHFNGRIFVKVRTEVVRPG